ncbi:MAG: cation diffusion facilitator family transporter [Cycloclasticus sp. symbiont of Poecilosclerida sp. M]|nr:MAG: cation diffusion facilitator family transporter [Cycloclasticus sp. symbiont of Poecilosclerida sp. M]
MEAEQIETLEKKKITVMGGLVNLVLSALKIGFGWLGQSHALIADGFHSLSDLLTDGLVYYAAHHSGQEADEEHPYGHARFETLGTVILGAVLIAVAGAIVWNAISRFYNDDVISYGWLVLFVAGISIVAKEAMYHLTMRTAKATKSALLKANAWHHRSDAISSCVVLMGVGLEMAGFQHFDSIAAIIVGLMVIKIGFDLVLDASKELVDTSLDAEVVEKIEGIILGTQGVTALHFLRTRKMGESALVDVHIIVEPMISVSEGHLISETVRIALINQVENIGEVMVHIDPEDDEEESPCQDLPLRKEVIVELNQAWDGLAAQQNIKQVKLHYLGGGVLVELELPLNACDTIVNAKALADEYTKKGLSVTFVTKVTVTFS